MYFRNWRRKYFKCYTLKLYFFDKLEIVMYMLHYVGVIIL